MSDIDSKSDFEREEFYRIKRLPPYVFAEVNKLKAKLRKDGMDIIDFGFGNPDSPTPQHIIDKLIETVQRPRRRLGLKRALQTWPKLSQRRVTLSSRPTHLIRFMPMALSFAGA